MKKKVTKLQALFAGMLFVLVLCVAYGVQSLKNEKPNGKNAVVVYTLNDVRK